MLQHSPDTSGMSSPIIRLQQQHESTMALINIHHPVEVTPEEVDDPDHPPSFSGVSFMNVSEHFVDFKYPLPFLILARPLVDLEKKETAKEAETRSLEERVRMRKRKIAEATQEAQQANIDDYAKQFDEAAKDEGMVLAEVGLQTLGNEQDRMDAEKKAKLDREKDKYRRNVDELQHLLAESRDQLSHQEGLFRSQIRRNELASIKATKTKEGKIGRAFSHAGGTLGGYLEEEKRLTKRVYNELTADYKSQRHNLAGGTHESQSSEWRYSPQLIEVHLVCLRCVKDKLPKGRYAVLCSVVDRLGGNVIDVEPKGGKRWRRVTAPRPHSGEYHLNNLVFNQSVRLFVPSQAEIRPAMAVQFELFLLKSKDYTNDQVLGWGAFPLIDSNFELSSGKFKVPMLFGPVDAERSKYRDIESAYRDDIDAWLANLYFVVQRRDLLPNPYTVNLVLDNETRQRHKRWALLEKRRSKSISKVETEDLPSPISVRSPRSPTLSPRLAISPRSDFIVDEPEGDSGDGSTTKTGTLYAAEGQKDELGDRKRDLIDDILHSESDSDDERASAIYTDKKVKSQRLDKSLDFLQYTFHFPHGLETSSRLASRIYYVVDEGLADLGLRNVASFDFWVSLAVLLLAAWIRAYLHVFGSWIFLSAARVPVSVFAPKMYVDAT